MCLVAKRSGHLNFPKGSLGPGESMREGALREWTEEAGIDVGRLALLQGAFAHDPRHGCRYLFAVCRAPTRGAGEPDEGCSGWAPPHEDPHDRDPITRAHWARVEEVLRREAPSGCRRPLKEFGVCLLECALAEGIARYLATVAAPDTINADSVARELSLPVGFVASVLDQRWSQSKAGDMVRATSRASAVATARAVERLALASEPLGGAIAVSPRERGGGIPPVRLLQDLIDARQCCRRQRDFARADGFREALEIWGIRIDDRSLMWWGPDHLRGWVTNPEYYEPRERRVGDWDCPRCDSVVYSHRSRCWNCHTSNPINSDARARSPPPPLAEDYVVDWGERASRSGAGGRRARSASRGRSRSVGHERPRAGSRGRAPPRAAVSVAAPSLRRAPP